jgi:hypothetical protein
MTGDSRWQPLSFQRLQSVQGTLTTGDYSEASLEDQFANERKTIPPFQIWSGHQFRH